MGNMAAVLQEAETAYSYGALEIIPGFFVWVYVVYLFLVFNVVSVLNTRLAQ